VTESELYGRNWCGDCAAAIRWEEELAKLNGLVVADVVTDRRGLHVAFATPDGSSSEAEFATRFGGIVKTKADIRDELTFAAMQLLIEVGDVGGCLFIGRRAQQAAARYLTLASTHLALLDADERPSFDLMEVVARRVIDRTAPLAPN
jgi:thiol-disulfide isomerase/thioredoxin